MAIGVYRIGFVTWTYLIQQVFSRISLPTPPGQQLYSTHLPYYYFTGTPTTPSCHLVLVSFPRLSFSLYRICITLYEMFEIVHSTSVALLYISALSVFVILTFVELLTSECIHTTSW